MKQNKVIASLLWKLLERGGTQGIQFIVQIILARLLLPEMYGTVALVTVFISLAQVFVQSGLGTALIQKKAADNVDFSSVFYLSLGLAGVLYALLFIFAPFISRFYHDAELIPVLRVLGIILFFGAVNGIQNAWVSRHMMFKELFKRSIGALLISGTAGVVAAYTGLGIWALVIQQLTNQAAVTIIMWFTVKWRPIRAFSFGKVKVLFSFGWKLMLSSLINQLYKDLRTLLIGRIYTPSMLGYYNKGQQFPKIIIDNLDGSIRDVMLPSYSAHQDDKKKLKAMMRRAIMTSSYIIFPLMIGMVIVAEPLVIILLTEKWLPAVPFLQFFCFAYALWPIQTANLQAINALGRSDISLKLQVIKKSFGVVVLIISVPMGIYAIAIGNILVNIASSVINAYPNRILLDYCYKEQISDILPSIGISIFMGVLVFPIKFILNNNLLLISIQFIVGITAYLVASKIFKVESFVYALSTLRKFFKKR